jgi:hypothetical protein
MSDKELIERLEAEQSMLVQTAQGITSDGETLTLTGITPSTLYFSDRPCGVRRRERRRDRRRF